MTSPARPFDAMLAQWHRVGLPGAPRDEGDGTATAHLWGWVTRYGVDAVTRALAPLADGAAGTEEGQERVAEAFGAADAAIGEPEPYL